MKASESAEIVMMLLAAYPNARTTSATSQVYEQALADLDAPLVRKAVTRLLSSSRFLPTIAEIREAATDLRLGPSRTGGEAWGEAMLAVRKYDRSESPKWSEPVMAEAMRLWGSWVDFCNSPADDPGGRARFIELYEQLAKRQRVDVVSGIALPAPSKAPLRLVSDENRIERDGQNSAVTRGVLQVHGSPEATGGRVPTESDRGNPDHAQRGPERVAAALALKPTSLRREYRRWSPEEIEAQLAQSSAEGV